ncbi:hypothetical protein HHI36_019297 [Cryptolaemus montrouzieri]|uniref:Uncharacterized protein n=1 Tax=Cryptolaemus montrouzieri TaxID=559131 RepID=A0ABD2P2H7_9CUCU
MSFTQEECEIYLKPSTELIPDEYQQEDNGKACVHIFIFKENMEKKFVDCMKCLEYNITENNVHPLSTRAEVISSLNKICLEIKEASSLIILFWGLLRADKNFYSKMDLPLNSWRYGAHSFPQTVQL